MNPKAEITYVLRSGQAKSMLPLENALLRMLDNSSLIAHKDYVLELHPISAPVDTGTEHRFILSLAEGVSRKLDIGDLLGIANIHEAMMFIRDLSRPVTDAFFYRIGIPAEQAIEDYLARNYGSVNDPIFLDYPPRFSLKPEILTAFYKLQDNRSPMFTDESSSNSEPVIYTVDLTDEDVKKRVKADLGIRNSACDLAAVTVNPETSEVTYTVKSALWGEKEHKVIYKDTHTWPLRRN